VRVQDVQPSNDLEYFLSSIQWVDAFPTPIQPKLAVLARALGAPGEAPAANVAQQQEEMREEQEFTEVDLDDFNRSTGRRASFLSRILGDR
jgi:hypothetical protein